MSKDQEHQKAASTATIPNKNSNNKTNSTKKNSQSNQSIQQNQTGQWQTVKLKNKQTLLRRKTNKKE